MSTASTSSGPGAGRTVTVSGVSGFVGSWTALTFLQRGWKVRGTVRSDKKTQQLRDASPELKRFMDDGQFEIVIVEDVITGDFTEALRGADTFAHTASPFAVSGSDNEKDFLKPALEGTRNALRAAKAANIKHFVVTSSFASVLSMADDKFPYNGKSYTESDWNPATYEEAAKSDVPVVGYTTSKKVAEEACWKFQKDEGLEGKMTVAAVCPPMIFGPFVHTNKSADLGESLGQIRDLVTGKHGKDEIPPAGFPLYADVRDVALVHVLAAEKGTNSRYLTANGAYDNQWVADFLHKSSPREAEKNGVATGTPGKYMFEKDGMCKLDTSKASKDLGVDFKKHSREQTFGDMIKDIFAHA